MYVSTNPRFPLFSSSHNSNITYIKYNQDQGSSFRYIRQREALFWIEFIVYSGFGNGTTLHDGSAVFLSFQEQ